MKTSVILRMYSDVIAHAVYHLCVITGGYPPFGNLWDTVQKDSNKTIGRRTICNPPKKINVFYLTEFNLELILDPDPEIPVEPPLESGALAKIRLQICSIINSIEKPPSSHERSSANFISLFGDPGCCTAVLAVSSTLSWQAAQRNIYLSHCYVH